MLVRCHYIRHQCAGLLTDRVYLAKPSEADLDEARTRLAAIHGEGHPQAGKGHPEHLGYSAQWAVTAEPACLIVPDGFDLQGAEPAEFPPDPIAVDASGFPIGASASVPLIGSAAVAIVTNPVEAL